MLWAGQAIENSEVGGDSSEKQELGPGPRDRKSLGGNLDEKLGQGHLV